MIRRATIAALLPAVLLPAAGAAAVFARFERQLLASLERPGAVRRLPDIPLPAAPAADFPVPDLPRMAPPPPPAGLPAIRAFPVAPPPVRASAPPAGIAPPPPPLGPRSALPADLGIRPPPAIAAAAGGRLLFEGIRDGLVDPRLPSSREPLAALLLDPGRFSRDDVFAALLGTFPGPDAPSRLAALERWAAGRDGTLAGEIAIQSARRHFLDGRFGLAAEQADSAAERFPALAGRARLVKAFALAQAGDFGRASETLAEAEADPGLLADRPEIRFMQAWIAIEEDRRGDAAALLRRILSDHPGSPFAGRARRALALLEEE
ncbi:MAG: tetratricopeptide repeat protein [Kiritimatiellia bacterium]|jgi:hypothetical protein